MFTFKVLCVDGRVLKIDAHKYYVNSDGSITFCREGDENVASFCEGEWRRVFKIN